MLSRLNWFVSVPRASVAACLRLGPALALALAAGGLVGCGAELDNAAPIIDSLEAPEMVRAQNGTYAIPVTLLFHDNDTEVITHLRYRLTPGITGTMDIPTPNPARESAAVTIVIPVASLGEEDERSERDGEDKSGSSVASLGEAKDGAANDPDGKPRGRGRSRTRVLSLTVIDGRGAESLPQLSQITLD